MFPVDYTDHIGGYEKHVHTVDFSPSKTVIPFYIFETGLDNFHGEGIL